MRNILLWSVTPLLAVTAAHAEPIASNDIYVLDGNTIDMHGQRIRLVGFDTPEEGQRARCTTERTLGARTAARLRQIISRGDRIDLQMAACACPPGTEGTHQCNNGWPCARLTVDGKDVLAVQFRSTSSIQSRLKSNRATIGQAQSAPAQSCRRYTQGCRLHGRKPMQDRRVLSRSSLPS